MNIGRREEMESCGGLHSVKTQNDRLPLPALADAQRCNVIGNKQGCCSLAMTKPPDANFLKIPGDTLPQGAIQSSRKRHTYLRRARTVPANRHDVCCRYRWWRSICSVMSSNSGLSSGQDINERALFLMPRHPREIPAQERQDDMGSDKAPGCGIDTDGGGDLR